jgi:diguanylate cyclase (GGDEF)-like protein
MGLLACADAARLMSPGAQRMRLEGSSMPENITEMVALTLVLAGVVALAASLLPLRKIVSQLPSGKTLRTWRLQAAMTVLFIAGYIAYAAQAWGRPVDAFSLVVPVVFFFGACFVWLNFTLALRTALDVRRIALLEQESITDELTGVYNRRYLQRRLLEEFERARRYGLPLSVLLLDIDHFKRINDQHGHPTGDVALRHFGALCLNTVRASDTVARYGGEELMVIAPHTSAAQALLLAERLRQKVEEAVLVVESEPARRHELRFTISVGAASLTADDANCHALVESADRALYCAKAEGRNRVSGKSRPATQATFRATATSFTHATRPDPDVTHSGIGSAAHAPR